MEIIRGHSTDLIASFDHEIDLCVTDPPYAFTGSGIEHEMTASVAVVLRETAKKLKKGSWMLVFCAASWRSVNYTIEATRGILQPARFGAWLKTNPRSRCICPGWKWSIVPVIAFRRGDKNRLELIPYDLPDSIVCPAERKGARAVLPDAVCNWAVEPYSIQDGVFLDPFAGSGGLVRAAEKVSMKAFGFEIKNCPAD